MIGYAPDDAARDTRGDVVNHVASKSGWVFPVRSEDVVLVGTDALATLRICYLAAPDRRGGIRAAGHASLT